MVYILLLVLGMLILTLAHLRGAEIAFDDPTDAAAARHQLRFPGDNVIPIDCAECRIGSGHFLLNVDLERFYPELCKKAGPFVLTMENNELLISQPPHSDGQCVIFGKLKDGISGNYLLPVGSPCRLHSGDRITIQLDDGTECTFYYAIQ